MKCNGSADCKNQNISALASDDGVQKECDFYLCEDGCLGTKGIHWEHGPEYTLETFKKYADDFQENYFLKKAYNVKSDDNVQNIECEYRRICENPTDEIEVKERW